MSCEAFTTTFFPNILLFFFLLLNGFITSLVDYFFFFRKVNYFYLKPCFSTIAIQVQNQYFSSIVDQIIILKYIYY